MAVIPKPGTEYEYAITVQVDGGGRWNIIEPQAAKKDTGWDYDEQPPRNYQNWTHHMATLWFEYLQAMTDANQKTCQFTIADTDTSGDAWVQTADYVVATGADATPVIEAAIAALPPAGGKIVLGPGIFECKTTINPVTVAGCWIQGQGSNTTLRANGAAALAVMDLDDWTYCAVTDLRLSQTGAAAYYNGIIVRNSKRFRIQRVLVEGFEGTASAYPFTPRSCPFAISLSTALIESCKVRLVNGGAAAETSECVLQNGGTVMVVNNEFTNENFGGPDVDTSSPCIYTGLGVLICVDNDMDHCDVGVYLATANGSIVGRNKIRDMGGDGISLDAMTGAIVDDNSISTVGGSGIALNATTEKNTVVNNHIDTTGAEGISLEGTKNSLGNNYIDGATGNGILVDGESHSIKDSHVDACLAPATAGINLLPTSIRCNVAGGEITNCDVGIMTLAASQDHNIHGLLVSDCVVRQASFRGVVHFIHGNKFVLGPLNPAPPVGVDVDGDGGLLQQILFTGNDCQGSGVVNIDDFGGGGVFANVQCLPIATPVPVANRP